YFALVFLDKIAKKVKTRASIKTNVGRGLRIYIAARNLQKLVSHGAGVCRSNLFLLYHNRQLRTKLIVGFFLLRRERTLHSSVDNIRQLDDVIERVAPARLHHRQRALGGFRLGPPSELVDPVHQRFAAALEVFCRRVRGDDFALAPDVGDFVGHRGTRKAPHVLKAASKATHSSSSIRVVPVNSKLVKHKSVDVGTRGEFVMDYLEPVVVDDEYVRFFVVEELEPLRFRHAFVGAENHCSSAEEGTVNLASPDKVKSRELCNDKELSSFAATVKVIPSPQSCLSLSSSLLIEKICSWIFDEHFCASALYLEGRSTGEVIVQLHGVGDVVSRSAQHAGVERGMR